MIRIFLYAIPQNISIFAYHRYHFNIYLKFLTIGYLNPLFFVICLYRTPDFQQFSKHKKKLTTIDDTLVFDISLSNIIIYQSVYPGSAQN